MAHFITGRCIKGTRTVIKLCSGCLVGKPLTAFHKDKHTGDGLACRCKACQCARRKQHYADNKEREKKYQQGYYAANKEQVDAKRKEFEQSPRRKAWLKQWLSSPIQRAKAADAHKYRLLTDIQFRLACNLRGRLKDALRKGRKVGSAVRDLGCTVGELKIHLESKFTEGMSWDNYGQWHVDHIKPLAVFDLTNRQQFLEACNWTNLQPLWAADNIRKGAKYDEEWTIDSRNGGKDCKES